MKDWQRPFDDPIPVPGDGTLITLADAADHIQKLTAAEQQREEWQTAIDVLIGAAEGRDFLMHARIGLLRALNRDSPAPARPTRAKAYRIIR